MQLRQVTENECSVKCLIKTQLSVKLELIATMLRKQKNQEDYSIGFLQLRKKIQHILTSCWINKWKREKGVLPGQAVTERADKEEGEGIDMKGL